MTKTMNQLRAEHAQMVASVLYNDEARGDHTAYIDMLSDIMHACRTTGLSFDNILNAAKSNFEEALTEHQVFKGEMSGPVVEAMKMARDIAIFQGEGLFHGAIEEVVSNSRLEVAEYIEMTRESALDDESFDFEDLNPEAQSQVRLNSDGMNDDDIIARGYSYNRDGDILYWS